MTVDADQTWKDNDPTHPVSATRMTEIEHRIDQVEEEVGNPPTSEPCCYVSKKGSDANSGLDWKHAFLTVHKAFEYLKGLSEGTGTVFVGVGVFSEKPLVRPYNCSVYGQGPRLANAKGGTRIIMENAGNGNVMQDEAWGTPGVVGSGGVIADLELHGNRGNQSITNAETITENTLTLEKATGHTVTCRNAASEGFSLSGFPASGYAWVGIQLVEYASKSATELKEVKLVYASTAAMFPEMRVMPFASVGHGLAIQSNRVTVRGVRIESCVGSARKYQGSGTSANAQYPYQCVGNRNEDYNANGYCLDIWAASDGMETDWISGGGELGCLLAGGADWIFKGGHPIGNPTFGGSLCPTLLRLCTSRLQFAGYCLDRAPYESVVYDCKLTGGNTVQLINFQGQLLSASTVAGSGAGVMLLGRKTAGSSVHHGSFQLVTGNSRISAGLTCGPLTQLVGEQNLLAISEASGKVQVLSALSLSPSSALGGTLLVPGSTRLSYTGRTWFGSGNAEVLAAKATSIKMVVPSGKKLSTMGLDPAGGIIVIAPNTSTETPQQALRVTYTGYNDTTGVIEGIPSTGAGSITEAIPAESGITQHFITGVGAGTATLPDGNEVAQPESSPPTMAGEWSINLQGQALSQAIPGTPSQSGELRNYQQLGQASHIFTTNGEEWKAPLPGLYRIVVGGGGGGGGGGGSIALTSTESTVLTNGSASGAALTVTALAQEITTGNTITVKDGEGKTQDFTLTAKANAGATSVAITSATVTLATGSGYSVYSKSWLQTGGSGSVNGESATAAPANTSQGGDGGGGGALTTGKGGNGAAGGSGYAVVIRIG